MIKFRVLAAHGACDEMIIIYIESNRNFARAHTIEVKLS